MNIILNLVVMAITYSIFYGIGYIYGRSCAAKKKGKENNEKEQK